MRLPERIHRRLSEGGAEYVAALAEQLGARPANVSGLLRNLLERGRVEIDHEDGRRVYYRAVGDPDELPWGNHARTQTMGLVAHASGDTRWPDLARETPDPELVDLLREIAPLGLTPDCPVQRAMQGGTPQLAA